MVRRRHIEGYENYLPRDIYNIKYELKTVEMATAERLQHRHILTGITILRSNSIWQT